MKNLFERLTLGKTLKQLRINVPGNNHPDRFNDVNLMGVELAFRGKLALRTSSSSVTVMDGYKALNEESGGKRRLRGGDGKVLGFVHPENDPWFRPVRQIKKRT